jgi:hypothetical protein
MIRKMMLGGLIAIAFIAGSISTGSLAVALEGGVGNNLIADAINALTQAVLGIPAVQGPPGPVGPEGPVGPPGGIIGFYKVREQITVTAAEAINGAVREATCDAGDFPISVGWFANPGNAIDGMSVDEFAGGGAGVFVRNLSEGSAYGVGVNCADFNPEHIP